MNSDLLPTRRVTPAELKDLHARIEHAKAQLQMNAAEAIRRDEEIRRALGPADEAEATAERLQTHRAQLVERLRSEPQVIVEIEEADAEIQQAQRRAQLFRESASTIPQRAELREDTAAIVSRIAALLAEEARLVHHRAIESLIDSLAAVEPLAEGMLATAADLDVRWHEAYGESATRSIGAPDARLARFIALWLRDLVGVRLGSMAWTRDAGSPSLTSYLNRLTPPDAFRQELASTAAETSDSDAEVGEGETAAAVDNAQE